MLEIFERVITTFPEWPLFMQIILVAGLSVSVVCFAVGAFFTGVWLKLRVQIHRAERHAGRHT